MGAVTRKVTVPNAEQSNSPQKNNMATEGNLSAPTRHPIDWKGADYYDEAKTFHEMERIFDICHGCRRCVSLCGSFPTLFDLVDESKTMEVDGVDRAGR